MKRVTIYDVANEAKVSLATVSRVINGLEIVREDTRARVELAIEKLGYKPNAIAQGLALQKTTTIALVVPEASFNYTGQIINGLLDVAKIYKYNIMLHTTTEGILEINEIIENIIKSRVDGVVIFNDKLLYDELKELTKYQFPIVLIGNRMSENNVACVYVDIEKAAYELALQYIGRGQKDIAIVQDRKNSYAINQLIKGVTRAFEENQLKFDQYIEIPAMYRSSYEFLSNYFKDKKHDLIIAYRDSQALAAINAANENGIAVPKEMEIICVIDTKYNAMVRPRLSSFSIPSYDLGAVAMRMMTKLLHQEVFEEREIELSYLYTPRQSTK
ncbi:MAG: LacI family DNA-binding transcriptional regulator [Erysipelotrichaceae bacterium]|nr:LacI family DNA-binding transcriptional regulator [Erysipelotrichaceae bacterium]MDP3306145.1 LacI family DNA-binding transcriptional regulator [Erysipelotrichaceae bacterium]